MTFEVYQSLKEALLEKKAEVNRSPEAAKKLLVDNGLFDLLEDDPAFVPKRAPKKAAVKKAVPKKK